LANSTREELVKGADHYCSVELRSRRVLHVAFYERRRRAPVAQKQMVELPFTDAKWHCTMSPMTNLLTVDKAGRVVLPKPVRDELQLSAGDSLELESSEDQIVLRPVRGNGPLRKKRGVWVFRTGQPLSLERVNETIAEVRRERDRDNLRGHDTSDRGAVHSKRGKTR
jgi:AbrB family looped-hinge helix DNA binding protein